MYICYTIETIERVGVKMNDNLPSNVEILKGETTGKVNTTRVLTAALISSLKDVVVIGYDKDDSLYFASSSEDPLTLWLLETAKKQLIDS